jgi:nucleoside-diphosphate-sugar epimerase
MSQKRAVVCGAGGFIAGHLVYKLKEQGFWVRGVDQHRPEYRETAADEFLVADLRTPAGCEAAAAGGIDEVYQLAADMGGMGFISSAETDIVRNNVLINANMIKAAVDAKVMRYFFASSVCIYRDMQPGEPEISEASAYPPAPDNEYGWEKLYSERLVQTHARHYPIAGRIARFENCYGPYGTWRGGREKAPAALCRKVAEAEDGGSVDIWGDGTAVRSFVYVSDLVDGIFRLMQSDLTEPTNIGTEEFVTVDELADTVARVAGKTLKKQHVDGPVGVLSRNFSHDRIRSLGWTPTVPLAEGIRRTYEWVEQQVAAARKSVEVSA